MFFNTTTASTAASTASTATTASTASTATTATTATTAASTATTPASTRRGVPKFLGEPVLRELVSRFPQWEQPAAWLAHYLWGDGSDLQLNDELGEQVAWACRSAWIRHTRWNAIWDDDVHDRVGLHPTQEYDPDFAKQLKAALQSLLRGERASFGFVVHERDFGHITNMGGSWTATVSPAALIVGGFTATVTEAHPEGNGYWAWVQVVDRYDWWSKEIHIPGKAIPILRPFARLLGLRQDGRNHGQYWNHGFLIGLGTEFNTTWEGWVYLDKPPEQI